MIGGTKFYERAEIKDAIAYLSLLANPFDVVSFTRIANSPAARHRADLAVAHRLALGDRRRLGVGGRRRARAVPGLGAAAVKALRRFMDTMDELRVLAGLPSRRATGRATPRSQVGPARPTRAPPVPVGDLLEAVLAQTGYVEALEAERTIEAQGRIENLEQLVEVAREFDAGAGAEADTLDVFLQQIALVADADTRSDDEGLVTLMTLHNAKGLEYPTSSSPAARTASSRTRARSTRAPWRRSGGCSTSASRGRCASCT